MKSCATIRYWRGVRLGILNIRLFNTGVRR
jgi:hypothetical protein